MARESRDRPGYEAGSDAAYIKPKFVPDAALLPRDDSGGYEWDPRTAEWDDGGKVTGDKSYLSARGGKDVDEEGGEESRRGRTSRDGKTSTRGKED